MSKRKRRNAGTISFAEVQNKLSTDKTLTGFFLFNQAQVKLQIILEQIQIIPKDEQGKPVLKALDLKTQNFYHKCLKPVSNCLNMCFNGNIKALLELYPHFPYSVWSQHCKALDKKEPKNCSISNRSGKNISLPKFFFMWRRVNCLFFFLF
jgi:hypothetical protein